MKKALRILFFGFCGLLLLLVALRPTRVVNRSWQDLLAKWAPGIAASGNVVIVSIDDVTIGKIGTWPWDRSQTAALFGAIAQAHPKVVAFDGWLPHRAIPLPGDAILADTLRSLSERGLRVILPVELRSPSNLPMTEADEKAVLPDLLRTSAYQLLPDKPQSDRLPLFHSQEILFSDPIYQESSSPTGFITSTADPEDDVFRNMSHVMRVGDEYFPSLAVAILAAWGDANLAEVSFAPGVVQIRETVIPVSSIGLTPLRFLGPSPSVPMIEASRILENPAAFRDSLEGRIVLIGVTTAAALNRESGDFFRTPLSDRFPGVEIWAVALENILSSHIPKRPGWARLWELFLAASLLTLSVMLARRRLPLLNWSTVVGIAFLAVVLLQMGVDRGTSVHTAMDLPFLGLFLGVVSFRLVRPPAPSLQASAPSEAGASAPGTLTGLETSASRQAVEDGIRRIGKYELVGELGRGAMGVVHKGYDRSLDRHVAIKVISASRRLGEKQDESFARFQREARAIAALNHPSIVTIYESDEWEDSSFIAMEFLDGHSLEKLLQGHRLSWKAVRIWGSQLMDALAYAHGNGVVHRDIKPANIMVVESGRRVKLTDFGLARRSDSSLTQEGQVLGTPYYMAPEQIDGRKSDGRADQFSLGVVLYEMIARRKPYEGEDVRQIMLSILLHPHPPLADLAQADIPKEAIVLIEKMMSKEADARFSSLEEAVEAWRRIPG